MRIEERGFTVGQSVEVKRELTCLSGVTFEVGDVVKYVGTDRHGHELESLDGKHHINGCGFGCIKDVTAIA